MKTITLDEPGRFSRSDTAEPGGAPAGEAIVRVRRVGVCGTDLHAYRGRQPFFEYPRILGHELGVEVVEAPANDRGLTPGDLCAVEPYLNCGECGACRRKKSNCCERLRVLGVHIDGGMRELITVPVDKLHPSRRLSLDQLALVETLGIGAHAVARAALEPGENVLVIGAGPIGLSVIQFAQVAGARVVLVELSPSRREFCRRHFGVESAIEPGEGTEARLREVLSGELPAAVFDATGNPGSMAVSFGYVANGGRLVLVGLVQGDVSFHDPEFHRREITLLATRNSLPDDFRRIVGLLEEGRIDTKPWITHRAGYGDFVEQFPAWLDREAGVVKAMLEL